MIPRQHAAQEVSRVLYRPVVIWRGTRQDVVGTSAPIQSDVVKGDGDAVDLGVVIALQGYVFGHKN